MDTRLNTAIKALAQHIKDWPEHKKKPIRDFVIVVQNIISEHEMECLSYDVAIRKSIQDEKLLLLIMESYGIDVSEALSKTRAGIHSTHDLAINCGVYKIPEKLQHEQL